MPESAQPSSGDADRRLIAQAVRVISVREQLSVSEARASLRAEAEAFGIPLIRLAGDLAAFDRPAAEGTG
ncbi:hypothetical protein [Actinomycetospora sp.]|jgi:hypothetical protein|uniref:hypothetical protein n=1 Tax=Actinomycetospora sp. TaxID=1872135 RepID=UPI002F3E90D6